jgi:hypothetical protein
LQNGFGGNFLFGAYGNEELYAGPGDDILIRGKSSDHLDCSDGSDIVIDFNPINRDTLADNCKAVLTYSPGDIESMYYSGSHTSLTNTTLSVDEILGRNILSMNSGVS